MKQVKFLKRYSCHSHLSIASALAVRPTNLHANMRPHPASVQGPGGDRLYSRRVAHMIQQRHPTPNPTPARTLKLNLLLTLLLTLTLTLTVGAHAQHSLSHAMRQNARQARRICTYCYLPPRAVASV